MRRNNLRFNLQLSTTADLEFFVHLSELGSIKIEPHPLVRYRIHSGQMHLSPEKLIEEYPRLLEILGHHIISFRTRVLMGNLYAMAGFLALSRKNLRYGFVLLKASAKHSLFSLPRVSVAIFHKRTSGFFRLYFFKCLQFGRKVNNRIGMFRQLFGRNETLIRLLKTNPIWGFLRSVKGFILRLYLRRILKNFSGSSIISEAVGQIELAGLCDKYGSDKGSSKKSNHNYPWKPHSYTDFYEKLFSHKRISIDAVFECGVGTSDLNFPANMGAFGKAGASLRVWQDYFPKAFIYGGDIDSSVLFNEGRIKTYHLDQTDPSSIVSFFQLTAQNEFDLMIDDGLHTFEAGSTLFNHSNHLLKQGGVYIIEDVRPRTMKKFLEVNFSSMGFSAHPVVFKGENGVLDLSALLFLVKT